MARSPPRERLRCLDEVRLDAWAVEDRYGLAWWDALIVAQAIAAGCDMLLTEDLRHDQGVFGIRIVNPFLEGRDERPSPDFSR